jgi:hypothetical protein
MDLIADKGKPVREGSCVFVLRFMVKAWK